MDPTPESQMTHEQNVSNTVEEEKMMHNLAYVEQLEAYDAQVKKYKREKKARYNYWLCLKRKKLFIANTSQNFTGKYASSTNILRYAQN